MLCRSTPGCPYLCALLHAGPPLPPRRSAPAFAWGRAALASRLGALARAQVAAAAATSLARRTSPRSTVPRLAGGRREGGKHEQQQGGEGHEEEQRRKVLEERNKTEGRAAGKEDKMRGEKKMCKAYDVWNHMVGGGIGD